MRVVFDTSVIVAGLVARGLCHELIEEYLPLQECILSDPLWAELTTILREKFDLEPGELPFLTLYRRHSTWVTPEALPVDVSRDPDDQWVLATAAAGEAEAIVTGDDDLLVLGTYEGIRILAPRAFLEVV